jgi:hypothetical protein
MTSGRLWPARAAFFAFSITGIAYAAACGEDYGAEPSPADAAIDSSSNEASTDATDAGAASDADAGSPCDLEGPFSSPLPVEGVNSAANEGKPRISLDELTIHFTRNGPDGAQKIYAAVRPTRNAPFGTPQPIALTTSSGDVLAPTFTADFLTVAFAQPVDGGSHLFIARRDSVLQSFSNATELAELNSPSYDGDPFISPDGLTLYFSSDRAGPARIYRATRSARADPFATPTVIDLADAEPAGPAVTTDDTMLFFRALRGPNPDLFVVRRITPSAFGAPKPLPELNGPDYDEIGSLSADGCRIYIRSTRDGGAGDNDIWMAERPKR